VEDGGIPAYQDSKFKRIASDPRIQNRQPRCLAGAEDYILANNGGNTPDSQNLLAYALLADKLDIFGNGCQAFTNKNISLNNKQNVSAYLQQPLTRQEVARYFALTTTIPELQLNPASDSTVDTKSEYILPVSTVVKEGEESSAIDKINSKKPGLPKPDSPAEPEEIIYITHPPSPEVTIEGCDTFATDRAGTEDMVKDCIRRLRGQGISEDEIDRRLKEHGVWSFVKDKIGGDARLVGTDGCSLLSPNRPNHKNNIDTCIAGLFNSGMSLDEIKQLLIDNGLWDRLESYVLKEAALRKLETNLDNYYNLGHSLEETLFWGLQGKENEPKKSGRVIYWYAMKKGITYLQAKNELERILEGVKKEEEKMKKEMEEFRIDRKEGYDVKGLEFQSIPRPSMNMDMGGLGMTRSEIKIKEVTKKFYITKQGNTDSNKADPNRNTYIIVHGWNAPLSNQNIESWTRGTAEVILGKDTDPDAQILLINWEDIAHTTLPIDASKWIDGVATTTADVLFKWGVNTDKTIFIGNSLGSLLSQELSNKLGGANVVGLAPAYWFTGYDVDFNGKHFAGFKNKGMCIVADGSISDSETLAKTCGEKYIVKYNDPHNTSFTKEFTKNVAANFVIGEIADVPLKSLNKGAFRTIVKAGNETLIIEVLSKDINGKEIVVGTAKAVGIDIASNWACSPALAAPVIGVLAHKACKAVVSTAVEEITDEIKRALVSKHMWVHETYEEIIRHPFTNMDNGRLDSIDHKAEFTDNSYKGMDGAIYTQKHAPTKIKYLLTSASDNLDRYTLYGNSQDNVFECKTNPWDLYIDTKKDCIMYGGGSQNGKGDIFILDFDSSDYIIKDFKRAEDPDKIIIQEEDALIFPNDEISIGSEPKLKIVAPGLFGSANVEVLVEGYSVEDIRGWVSVATGKYVKKDGTKPTESELKTLKRENPIQI